MDIEAMNNEISDIRERLVKIECTLEGVQRVVERKEKSDGAIVIPITVAVAAVEVLKIILERLLTG